MKTKLFTFFLALVANVGTIFAWDYERVQIGDLYYYLDVANQTAEVTSQLSWSSDNYSGLTAATIPASVTYNSVSYSVTSIGNCAFQFCTGLTSVTIPNSVTSIGEGAFGDCTGLTSVTIPNSVTSIGERAFYGCSGLTSVTIPNSVTSIGDKAFSLVANIVYSGSATGLPWGARSINGYVDGYLVYSDETKTNLLACSSAATGDITIPNSVTSIGDYAFHGCSSLTSVTIGNSVTSIGDYAFAYCSILTSVTIPNSVTSIGDYAFLGCSSLTSVTIPNSVISIGSQAFSGCSSLTSLEIPNSVTSIGDYAFNGCSGLTSVTIGDSVKSIGYAAFYDCTGLTSVTIPNSVTSIEAEDFRGCTGLTSMEAPAGFYDIPEVEWPNCTKILNHVIVNGGELTENALLFINRSYKTLRTLDVSGATNTEFADEAFKGYYNLTELKLPAGLQKVSYMMVAGCKNLQSIEIPESVEEIEQSAFEDCRSIQTITFGGAPAGAPGRFNAPAASTSQLRRIGNWAFYNAHELQNLEIPEGVTEIGDGAFYGCTYLEEMVLPSSVQSIGDNCFALCAKLTKITCNAVTPPTIQAKTFYDVKRQIPVYVPDECVDAYKNDVYWQEFDIQGQSNMPHGLEEISSSLQGGDRGRLILHNGQILILRGDKTYTLQGQEVK